MRRVPVATIVLLSLVAVSLVAVSPVAAPALVDDQRCGPISGRSITYVGVTEDKTDFDSAAIGRAGFWFPQFDADQPVAERPTEENARDALPAWVGPLNHFPSDPDFATRTFSQDGPARSKGGQPSWDTLTLPGGEAGLSGAVVDPATAGNTNNTINRIQLRGDVPSTFYFHIVTDNTAGEHDPVNLVRARGNAGPQDRDDTQVEADTWPETDDLTFNGTTDLYTFRYDGFVAGDYIKVRLNGAPAPAGGASFGGLLFDETFAADPAPDADVCGDEAGTVGSDSAAAGLPAADPARPMARRPSFTG